MVTGSAARSVGIVILVLAVLSGTWASAGEVRHWGGTVAPFKKAPFIDGKLSPGEWDGAVETTGFQGLFAATAGMLDARKASAYFGFTPERLYIAIVSEYPPDGKDHSSGDTRDKDYVFDESIEIWLDPNRDNRESQKGDLRFYQMNANAKGGIYDISFDPKKGPNTGWNGNWEFANTVDHDKHVWVAELSLPFADLGWQPGTAVGRTIGVLISRNFKGPWEQVTWFPVLGAFIDWYRYAAIRLTADEPSVQISSLGDNVQAPHLQLRATVFNPGPARKAKVTLLLTSSDMPEVRNEQELALPAGGRAAYSFDDVEGRLHADATHTLAFDVTSPDGSQSYMHYGIKWTKAPEKRWQYRIGPDPDAAVRFAYYPSYQFVRVMVDTRELTKELADKVRRADVRITGPDGKLVLAQAVEWEKPPSTSELKVGDLPDGEYTLTVTVEGWKDPFVRKFKRVHFPFEGNRRGITDEVVAPFTPVKVEGDAVSVVFRRYVLDGLGFWKSVKAEGNVSAGGPKELLAAPVALLADGKPLEGTGKFTAEKPIEAVYEGKAQTTAVTVSTRCTTEVDGCTRYELTLAPGSGAEELKSLVLDIPLVDALMPLWHVSTTGMRINPAGATPAGQGVAWDSRQFPDGNWYGNFKCYLWLGAEERGLCWFADNDRGWELAVDEKHPDKSVACQEIIRKDGVLTLRLNLVQKPLRITEPRTIVFGLMATPAKPMRADWRGSDWRYISQFNMGYCTPASYCAKEPWGNDWCIVDWAYAARTGKPGPTAQEVEAWKQRNFPADMDPKFREGAIKLALGWLSSFNPRQKYYKMYFDEFHTTAQVEPESHVFQSEWSGRWYGPLLDHAKVEAHKMWGIGVSGIVQSHRDFACYYAAEWVKRGIGCYFDNALPMCAWDPLTTSAYRLPNGRMQPSAGMWARRDYLKRVWTIHRLMAPKDALPAMMIHMTNTHIVPYMGWNDENLDLEWKFGPEPQQSKYSADFLRAESIGRQSGNVPYVIAKVMDAKTPEQNEIAHRTKFGTMMVHEIRWWGFGEGVESGLIKIMKDFGYALDDCKVYNYWDDDCPVKTSDPEAKTLLLKRGDSLMLLVCTWRPDPSEVKFMLDLKALGVSPASAQRMEPPPAPVKGQQAPPPAPKPEEYALDAAAGSFTVPLEGFGVRIILIK